MSSTIPHFGQGPFDDFPLQQPFASYHPHNQHNPSAYQYPFDHMSAAAGGAHGSSSPFVPINSSPSLPPLTAALANDGSLPPPSSTFTIHRASPHLNEGSPQQHGDRPSSSHNPPNAGQDDTRGGGGGFPDTSQLSPVSKMPLIPTSEELLREYGPKSQRAQFACDLCRKRKARCSGTEPCDRCIAKKHPCTFSGVENQRKVTRSLKDLRNERSSGSRSPNGSSGALKMYFDKLEGRRGGGDGFASGSGGRGSPYARGDGGKNSPGTRGRRVFTGHPHGMSPYPSGGEWLPPHADHNGYHTSRRSGALHQSPLHYVGSHGAAAFPHEAHHGGGYYYSANNSPVFHQQGGFAGHHGFFESNNLMPAHSGANLGLGISSYGGPVAHSNGVMGGGYLPVPLGYEDSMGQQQHYQHGYPAPMQSQSRGPAPPGWRSPPIAPPPAPATSTGGSFPAPTQPHYFNAFAPTIGHETELPGHSWTTPATLSTAMGEPIVKAEASEVPQEVFTGLATAQVSTEASNGAVTTTAATTTAVSSLAAADPANTPSTSEKQDVGTTPQDD